MSSPIFFHKINFIIALKHIFTFNQIGCIITLVYEKELKKWKKIVILN